MRARVLAGIFIVAALGWLVVRAAGDAGAAGPSTIARGLPGSAVAYVEVDDVGALLRSWTEGSRLEKAWRGSDAKSAFEKTFVYLRLVDRLGKLEELGGFTIDAAALAEIFGRGGGLAVYDVSDTTFVAEAKLSAAELAKTRLSKAWASLPHRSFAGVDYVIGEAGGKSLLIAQVGARLVASNSVDRFHEALVLSAREEKVKTDGSEKPVASLGDDEVYVGLVKVVPASARVRVFARLSELRGTHQFDDFWVFGKESRRLAGLDAAMLALTISKDEVREDRFWAYGEGSKAPATGGRVDVVQTAAKLPAGGLWVGTELTDGRLAAERIVRLLPSEIAQAPVEEGRHRRRHHADEDEGAGAGDAGDKAAAEPAPDEPPAAAPLPPGLAGR